MIKHHFLDVSLKVQTVQLRKKLLILYRIKVLILNNSRFGDVIMFRKLKERNITCNDFT